MSVGEIHMHGSGEDAVVMYCTSDRSYSMCASAMGLTQVSANYQECRDH